MNISSWSYIDDCRHTKYESKGAAAGYSCSCTNYNQILDNIPLSFEEYFELMSRKIIQQKRSSSMNTIFESSMIINDFKQFIETESVSCILWPSFGKEIALAKRPNYNPSIPLPKHENSEKSADEIENNSNE